MTDPNIYISLLALADTATSTEEYLKHIAAAERMAETNPSLRAQPQLAERVAELADRYRATLRENAVLKRGN
jgi:hypothetical protein